MVEPMNSEAPRQPDRRSFLGKSLGLAAGAAMLPSCGNGGSGEAPPPAPSAAELPDGLDPADFITHGKTPWTIETKRAGNTGLVTPTDHVFVRGNLPFPPESILNDADGWELEVAGVGSPRKITVAELKALGRTSVAAVHQCSGNGRKFFEHGASGTQWGTGAAANVIWTGVPVRTVLEALGGIEAGAQFLTGTGGEPIPAGLEERKVVVERSVPLEAALAHGILAWEMNSEPLTISHGGPLRMVIPGFYGVNNVKYLKRLAPTVAESDAKIQVSGYRVRPIGESGAATQPSMWSMNVKSWIDSPLGQAPIPAGRTQVTGVAFCGEAPVTSVEVTADGGKTWAPADLVGPDLGPFAWRTFAFAWEAAAGSHLLATRAKDAAGNVQPELRRENERGYAHNGWRDHGVKVDVV